MPKNTQDLMKGVNKVILVGNLGDEPEVKILAGEVKVAKFSVATTELYKDQQETCFVCSGTFRGTFF